MTDESIGAAAADSNEFLKMSLDQEQYEKLEQDFNATLQSMVGESSMLRFQNEYEKLFGAFKTSYESEKRLVKRCKELNDTIESNTSRFQAALPQTQENPNTISVLRREVERAWKIVETAKHKEEKARDIISKLKHENARLEKIIEDGNPLSASADNQVYTQAEKEFDADAEKYLDMKIYEKKQEIETLNQNIKQNEIKTNVRTQEEEKSKEIVVAACLNTNFDVANGGEEEEKKDDEVGMPVKDKVSNQ